MVDRIWFTGFEFVKKHIAQVKIGKDNETLVLLDH